MAKQTVGQLYVKLGLDVTDLDSDFALAGRTVNDAMAKLGHEMKALRIKTDIDISSLTGANTATAELTIREKSLNEQLRIQTNRVKIADAAYKEIVKTKGADSAASAKLETRLLNEQRAYANIARQLKDVKDARAAADAEANKGLAANTADRIAAGANLKQVALGAAGDIGITSMLSSPMLKAAGVATAVTAGIVSASKSAMAAGEGVYQLATKMHTTNAEAAQMARAFKMAGADVNSAIPAMIRLDKTVQDTGAAGQQMNAVLNAYGVTLRDANGNLLPINQQLENLAQGYRNAAAAGLESEFVTQTLGSRGAELVPVLQEMYDIQNRMARMPTNGLLDPDKAHQMMMDYREMQMEMNQISGSLGAALMPVAADVLPSVVSGIESVTQAIRDNKDGIKAVSDIIGDIVDITGDVVGIITDNLPPITGGLETLSKGLRVVDDLLKSAREHLKDIVDLAPGASAALKFGMNFTPVGLAGLVKSGINKAYNFVTGGEEEKTETPTQNAVKEALEPKKVQGTTQTAEETRAKIAAMLAANQKAAETATQAAPKVPDISADVYHATHNDLQNQLYDIDRRADELRKEGVAEAEIVELTEARKAKVYKDYNRDVVDRVNASWKSELQNRLDDIEREKQAWIEKGLSEVRATQWAENEKGKVRQNAALSALKEQRQYLDLVKNALSGPGTMAERMNNARVAVLQTMRQKMGISNDYMTPGLLDAFSTVMNDVKNNLVRGLETQSWAKNLESTGVAVIRGTSEARDIPSVTNNVIVNGGVFEDNQTLQKFSDRTADKFIELYRGTKQSALLGY